MIDANYLIKWAKEQGISIQLTYWESDETYSVETISPALAEVFYMKRCYSMEDFIEKWNKNLKYWKKEEKYCD